jgi:nitronate monooxygenase
MHSFAMPSLRIGRLESKLPIIQGGMGVGISLSGLAAAVANEGAIGVIAATGIGMLEPDFVTNFHGANDRALRREIALAREKTKGIIGVNVMVALTDFNELVLGAVEEGADLILMGAGLPLKELPLDKLRKSDAEAVPIVSSARAARLIFQYWSHNYNHVPNAVVLEGPKAGGHLGFKKEQINDSKYDLEKLLADVLATLVPFQDEYQKEIPVIVAGGIFTGADIYKFLQLGAAGVQMATRFIATEECDASLEFKQSIINCKEEDLIIIDSPVGLPGRAVRNQFLVDVAAGVKKPFKCPWKCLKICDYRTVPYCIALALTNAKQGFLKDGFTFSGANGYRLEKITTVHELMEEIKSEYAAAVNLLPNAVTEKKLT